LAVKVEGRRSVDIAADADRLWAMVAEVTRMGEWSPITVSARWLEPSTGPALGARFAGTNRLPIVKRWTSVATITRCQPGRALAFDVGRRPGDPNTTLGYQFEPTPVGTRVTESWHMHREPWPVLVYYRLVGQERRIAVGVDQTLARLKAAAERRPGPR